MKRPERQRPIIGKHYVRFDVSTNSFPDTFAFVDVDDWWRVSKHRWSAFGAPGKPYVRGWVGGAIMLLHRFIITPPGDMAVDHMNVNPLDNRRANLHICTNADNIRLHFDRERGGPKPVKPVKAKPRWLPQMETVEEWRAWREEMREHETRIKNEQSTNNRRLTKKRH
jgi:hypothetical protein